MGSFKLQTIRMSKGKETGSGLKRLEPSAGDIRYLFAGKNSPRGAVNVSVQPFRQSLAWTAEPSTTEEKVELLRPFLELEAKSKVPAAYVEFTLWQGGLMVGERNIDDAREKLNTIAKLGDNVIHFSLEVGDHYYNPITLRHTYAVPGSDLVAVNGTHIDPEYIHDLFLASATLPLRPLFDEVVQDLRQHNIAEPPQ